MRLFFIQLILLAFFSSGISQEILPLKSRAEIIDKIQKDRLDNLLPKLMSKSNIDIWVLIAREYNEDPVIKTLLPATWLNARRRTILVFSWDKETNVVERVAITRYPFGKLIPSIWDKEKEPDQWKALADYITSKNPNKIGVNISEHFALADGLVKTDYEGLKDALPKNYQTKIVSAEKLAISWIETRTDFEMVLFSQLVEITHSIIKEAFSNKVIKVGKTTTDDIVWWMRE